MKKNVGFLDSIIRFILAAAIFGFAIVYHSWWGLLGLIPFITGIIGYCGIYSLLGISTRPKK